MLSATPVTPPIIAKPMPPVDVDAGVGAPGAGPVGKPQPLDDGDAAGFVAPAGTLWEEFPPTTPLERGMFDAWQRADAVEQVGMQMNAGNASRVASLSGRTNALTDSLMGVARIAARDGMPEMADIVLQASQATAQLAAHSVVPKGLTMPLDQQVDVVNGIASLAPQVKELMHHTPEALLEKLRASPPPEASEEAPPAAPGGDEDVPLGAPDEPGPTQPTDDAPPTADESWNQVQSPGGDEAPGAPADDVLAAPVSLEAPMDPFAAPLDQVRPLDPALQAAIADAAATSLR